jgi:hypothetical protein
VWGRGRRARVVGLDLRAVEGFVAIPVVWG